MRVLDRGQRTCVNTNINGTAGSISIIVEKTCAAQHTGCSGLGWPGLGWPRAPTFSPHWLTASPSSPVWRCDPPPSLLPDKYLNDQNLLRPLDGSQVLVLSSAAASAYHFSFLIFLIFIRTSESGGKMTEIVDDKVMKILHIRLNIICIILKGFLTDVSWLMLMLMAETRHNLNCSNQMINPTCWRKEKLKLTQTPFEEKRSRVP